MSEIAETLRHAFPEQCHDCRLVRGCIDLSQRDALVARRRAESLGNLARRGDCEGRSETPVPLTGLYIVGDDCSFRADMVTGLVLDRQRGYGVPPSQLEDA